MRTPRWLLIPLALVVLGCDQPSVSTAADQASTTTTAPTSAPPKEIPANSPVPVALKTAAYDYYGLDNRQPLPMKETDGEVVNREPL